MRNRYRSLLLVVIIAFTSLSITIASYAKQTVRSNDLSIQWVNPFLGLSISDITPALNASGATQTLADVEVLESDEEIKRYILEQYKLHTETIVFDFRVGGTLDKERLGSWISGCFYHTGVPNEGDYIRWHVGSYNAGISNITVSGGIYSGRTTVRVVYVSTYEQEQQMEGKIQEVLESLNLDDKDDLEKVQAVYGYICDNITYDYEHVSDSTYVYCHSAHAALFEGTAVCQGYATLLYRMLLTVGIDTRLIAGVGGSSEQTGEAHGWNIVKLGDYYYHLDSTWDAGEEEYDYFLLNMEDFTKHFRWEEYKTDAFMEAYPMSPESFNETKYYTELLTRGDGISASVIAGDNSRQINLNYYFQLPNVSIDDSLRVAAGIDDENVLGAPLEDLDPEEEWSELHNGKVYEITKYRVSVPVPASYMTGQVKVALGRFGSQDAILGCAVTMQEYLDQVLAMDGNEGLRPAICALLNYGTTAQVYFQVHEENYANDILEEEETYITIPTEEELAQYEPITTEGIAVGEGSAVKYYGSSLLVESGVTLRHYFTLTDDLDPELLQITLNLENYGQENVDLALQGEEGLYYVDIPGLSPISLDRMFDLEIRYGSADAEMSYSVMSYLGKAVHSEEAEETLIKLCFAMFDMAKQFALLEAV